MKACIRTIDLETGPDPIDGEPGIVEVGYCDLVAWAMDLVGEPTDWSVYGGSASYVNPGRPIPPETSAIHNIVDEDVAAAPAWSPASEFLKNRHHFQTQAPIVAFAAHNAEHERGLLGDLIGDLPIICTYKIALRLYPGAPSFSNNAIRYFLNPDGLDREMALPTHRAFPDSYVTAFTVREALNAGHSIETLIKWTKEPGLLPRCKIGKWRNGGKGTPYKDVDSGFLRWMLSPDKDFSADEIHTARYHLNEREIDQRLDNERVDLNRQFRANSLPETPTAQELPPVAAYETQEMFPL